MPIHRKKRRSHYLPAPLLLTMAFFEGAAVMACELLGAKLTAPYFGSSIYVWAAVLGITLTALMSGYYLGGYLSEKIDKPQLLPIVLSIAGGLLTIMPFTSQLVMRATIDLSVQLGATLALSCFMLPPLLFMGMSSPIIINLLNRRVETSGKTAGSVYAISTLGGILSTFLMGFSLMPRFGLRLPALIFGSILIILCMIPLIRGRKIAYASISLVFLIIAIGSLFIGNRTSTDTVKILDISEGVLGQIKVVDLKRTEDGQEKTRRVLLVNNILQTGMDLDDPTLSQSSYILAYAAAASIFPKGSKALVLGLGGGALVRHFEKFGFDIAAVEIDPRIRDAAMRHFQISPKMSVTIDDARHFLNQSNDQYDLIALDLFLSESLPAEVLSLEGLLEAKRNLKPDGVLAINFPNDPRTPEGRLTRSFIHTLRKAGFQVKCLLTPEKMNALILASPEGRDFSSVDYTEGNLTLRNLEKLFLDLDAIDFSDAVVLDDAHSQFETLHANGALEWRNSARQQVKRLFVDGNLKMVQ